MTTYIAIHETKKIDRIYQYRVYISLKKCISNRYEQKENWKVLSFGNV